MSLEKLPSFFCCTSGAATCCASRITGEMKLPSHPFRREGDRVEREENNGESQGERISNANRGGERLSRDRKAAPC